MNDVEDAQSADLLQCDGTSNSSGTFSFRKTGLNENTTYYYRAYVREWNGQTQDWEFRYASQALSFTTTAQEDCVPGGWLEMPAWTTSGMSGTTTSPLSDLYPLTHYATLNGRQARNYSCLYDPAMFASYWVAYPLCFDHVNGSGRSDCFAYDPDVPTSKQTNLTNGAYGVSINTPNYTSNYYARGHQIANADRNGNDAMCEQTFYMTNLTPQIQNGFNGGIWQNLEEAVRGLISSDTSSQDTVYVVTGASFRKKTDGTETITTITNTRDGKTVPVPNYYWKALLKVTWDNGAVVSAKSIAFWYPHQDLKGQSYYASEYVVSVAQIQTWTGFDLFHNLPDDIETAAEANTDWQAFQNFSF